MTPRNFWTYKAPPTPDVADLPAGTFAGTRDQWESLTPGMRREIARQAERRVQAAARRTQNLFAEMCD